MTTQTTADIVSARLDNDGTKYRTSDGWTLDELVLDHHGRTEQEKPRDAGGRARHVFPDGSAIVCAGGGWDVEGSEPFSWRSCPAA